VAAGACAVDGGGFCGVNLDPNGVSACAVKILPFLPSC